MTDMYKNPKRTIADKAFLSGSGTHWKNRATEFMFRTLSEEKYRKALRGLPRNVSGDIILKELSSFATRHRIYVPPACWASSQDVRWMDVSAALCEQYKWSSFPCQKCLTMTHLDDGDSEYEGVFYCFDCQDDMPEPYDGNDRYCDDCGVGDDEADIKEERLLPGCTTTIDPDMLCHDCFSMRYLGRIIKLKPKAAPQVRKIGVTLCRK